tara:strand:+ start:5800 stop:6318 length:519 start_codon:yes stop_codon:yes gene_type:complete
MQKIKSKKFILRAFKQGDEKSLQKSINNKKIYNNTSRIPYPYTMQDAKEWTVKNMQEYKKKNPELFNFVIDINSKVAGSVGFSSIKNKQAELGYWLAEKYWNQGIMTKAVKLALGFALKDLGLRRIIGRVFTYNPASRRVMEKAGFKFEKVLKNDAEKYGKKIDSWLMIKEK